MNNFNKVPTLKEKFNLENELKQQINYETNRQLNQFSLNYYKKLKQNDLAANVLLQVHDELILETNVSDCDATKKLLITNMEKAANLDVPLEVDVGLGNNWDQAH